ncbi:methionyl-tRNA formyltransferase [Hyphococcus sp.]|uniref:methionyl-tRNA formyltransferase n=1 Tax=Hyphococcus sp. TaxID=2038636 RepID=UPI0020814982|nr:MAG: methionyl-tRNA formyltransferase [Marinicaulis sp.]
MRLAFMGTPEFSVGVLAELIAAGHEIAAVYTRVPQPSGRGQKLTPSPVHRFAQTQGLDVRTPKNFKLDAECDAFVALGLDVAIVVAYGVILPQPVLDAPRNGCLNLHASLLPRWRGAAPIQRAIMAGDKVTGVQVMRMEAGLDTGPVLLSETVTVNGNDTAGTLHDKLAVVAAQLCPRALAALSRGGLSATRQNEEGVTYAHKISSEEARIDWSCSAVEIDRHIRGLSPFPGAWFESGGERVKALLSRVAAGSGKPGEVLDTGGRLVIACGEDAVELLTLQRAGKRVQQADEFLRGFTLAKNSVL